MKPDFTRKLLRWNRTLNHRDMPWKGESDPYRIWLSEVILQQTRVEQGRAYYERFIHAYPDVAALARAPEGQVLKLWEGLGYYSRCRNLMATARFITNELGGKFPDTYEKILQLKGVGPYTAAAIASFAFNEKRAVVDGNVQRVLARYFGISTPVGSTEGKRLYATLAQSLIDHRQPGAYNQAIMDFGATICRPRNPLCGECMQAPECVARRNGYVHLLPVKEKTLAKKTRWFYYFAVIRGGSVLLRRREGRDIWQHLHEFVLFEHDEPLDSAPASFLDKLLGPGQWSLRFSSAEQKQTLSHQTIRGRFFVVDVRSRATPVDGYEAVAIAQLAQYAFPRYINNFLEEPGFSLL